MTETAMRRILNIYDDMKEYMKLYYDGYSATHRTKIHRCVYDIFSLIKDNVNNNEWRDNDGFILDIIIEIWCDNIRNSNITPDINLISSSMGLPLPLIDIRERAKLKKYNNLVKEINEVISIKSKTIKSTYLKLGYTRGATRGLIKQDLLNLYDSSYMISN